MNLFSKPKKSNHSPELCTPILVCEDLLLPVHLIKSSDKDKCSYESGLAPYTELQSDRQSCIRLCGFPCEKKIVCLIDRNFVSQRFQV